jgi:penicillin-binding protein 2
MARSTDTFFYKLGEFVGVEKLKGWGHKFGLDEPTGVDLPQEVAGLVPSPEWKLKVRGERWFLGNTYHMSIGQGDIALTPIGINTAISAIASGGELCRPKVRQQAPQECTDLGMSDKTIMLVKEGMKRACSSGGTGFTFFDFQIPTGCKTGTAETGDGETTHAWFVAFAPVDFPEIVATVLVEKGGEGSSVAGPIAREIFDYWFGVAESTQDKQERDRVTQD